MARTVDPRVAKVELENLLKGVAKQLIHGVYGYVRMPWGTRFADLANWLSNSVNPSRNA